MLSLRHLVPVFSYLNSCTTPIPKLLCTCSSSLCMAYTVYQNFKMWGGPFPPTNSVLVLLLIKFLSYCYHIPLRHHSPPAIISLSFCCHFRLLLPCHVGSLIHLYVSLSSCYHIPLRHPSPPAIICLLLLSLPSFLPCHMFSPSPIHVSLSSCYQYSSPSAPCNPRTLL